MLQDEAKHRQNVHPTLKDSLSIHICFPAIRPMKGVTIALDSQPIIIGALYHHIEAK